MTILCGHDFSPASDAACQAAALLAKQHNEPLVLVHAVSTVTVPPMAMNMSVMEELRASAETALTDLASRLGGAESQITTRILAGAPDEAVLSEAANCKARLIVVGSVGMRGLKWLLGSTADRVLAKAHVPVLVIREGFPAAEWLRERTPLRVTVASELAASSEAAIDWAAQLAINGPCEFVVTHLSWPPEAYARLAIETPMHLDRTHPLVAEIIRRDLSGAAVRLEKAGPTRIVVASNMGSTAAAIAQIAARERTDLLVVGRGREEARHWWEQSISRAVLRYATMSVLCVPEATDAERLPRPTVHKIFAATDFSYLGNAAVAYALRLVPNSGETMLAHVVDDDTPAEEREALRARLLQLAAEIAPATPVCAEILSGTDEAYHLSAAAERFGADIVCVGSRGRSGLTKALLGSVSQALLLRSRRPVLIVPAVAPTSG